MDIYDDIAYVYDGTLEGLLCAVFASYANHEDPSDVVVEGAVQPRLAQRVVRIGTDAAIADRVHAGLLRDCGRRAFGQIARASISSDPGTGTAIYRFIRYAMDDRRGSRSAIDDISHPAVAGLFAIKRGVDSECEKVRQFARFEHLRGGEAEVWFAKISPRDSVVPLVLGHFIERFSVQPFILHDEAHGVAGVWDGAERYLVDTSDGDLLGHLPGRTADEAFMQDAWRRFYRSVAIDSRYNPELRRHFMPIRFWGHLTEMQPDVPAIMGPSER